MKLVFWELRDGSRLNTKRLLLVDDDVEIESIEARMHKVVVDFLSTKRGQKLTENRYAFDMLDAIGIIPPNCWREQGIHFIPTCQMQNIQDLRELVKEKGL